MYESGALQWREVVEKHHSAMVDELSAQLDSEVRNAVSGALAAERSRYGQSVARACDEARRSHAELLNQALRRLRHAGGQEQVLQLLAESCAQLASQVVVLVFENTQARSIAMKGLAGASASGITFAITEAPALVSAIESRDPVVAIASAEEISPALANAFCSEAGASEVDDDESGRAYLFPLVARHMVIAVLVASGAAWPAPLELLCGTAAIRIEALLPETPGKSSTGNASWEDLSPEEQKIHLQAQRMARVRVAEMRLYREEALRQGTAGSGIYKALQSPIDAARQEFLETFVSRSPTMVDYLHLEILRSLASDDDRLLGSEYPGPMV